MGPNWKNGGKWGKMGKEKWGQIGKMSCPLFPLICPHFPPFPPIFSHFPPFFHSPFFLQYATGYTIESSAGYICGLEAVVPGWFFQREPFFFHNGMKLSHC